MLTQPGKTLRDTIAQFLGRLALVPAEFDEQREYSGIDAATSRSAFLACSGAPATRWRRSANRPCPPPVLEDQVKAGAQPVPAVLERRDVRVAAGARAMVPAEGYSGTAGSLIGWRATGASVHPPVFLGNSVCIIQI
jgi:hypothetical protein